MNALDKIREQAQRLRSARMVRFKTATEGWQHVRKFTDVSKATYIQHENGTRGFKARAEDYARAFDVTPAWLLWNNLQQSEKTVAKTSGESLGHIMPPAHLTGGPPVQNDGGRHSLVVVPDEANTPRLRRGETVVVGPPVRDIAHFVSREVLAKSMESPAVLCRLQPGSAEGLWTLEALDPVFTMHDREVEWICPVLWIRVSPPVPEKFGEA